MTASGPPPVISISVVAASAGHAGQGGKPVPGRELNPAMPRKRLTD
jgi:hypothetical protein